MVFAFAKYTGLSMEDELMYKKNTVLYRHKNDFREGKLKADYDKGKIFCVQ